MEIDNRTRAYSPALPLLTKRVGNIGSDLVISFITDLYQCETLSTEKRLISSGSFSAGAYLCFNTPFYIFEVYPTLLSQKRSDKEGMPLVLTMFKQIQARDVGVHWEGEWFSVNARVHPYRLPLGDEGSEENKISLGLPRGNALLP
jgi:hypothetical protein